MSREELLSRYEKERIHVLEIDVPRCKHVHGSSPCTAIETGDAKCYNTFSTCNDLENYDDVISYTGALSINKTNKTITETAGFNFETLGVKENTIIELSGFSLSSNNTEFVVQSVSVNIITVKDASNLITEFDSGATLSFKNIYTYKFCSDRSPHPIGMNNIIPCINNSIDISPAKLDESGGIGVRINVSVNMNDFPYADDNGVDPYLNDRTFNPFERSLFWIKWRARNENYDNYAVRVLSGYLDGEVFNIGNFDVRNYVLNRVSVSNGSCSLTAKDPLQLITNKNATAPTPTNGTLSSSLTDIATTATLQPSGIGNQEYSASGFVKVTSEVMAFTRSGDTLTLTRGQFNTLAKAHDVGDTVQECLHFNGSLRADQVQSKLFVDYANVPSHFIPYSQWASEVDTFLTSNPNRLITDPMPVKKLSQELCEQWSHKFAYDEKAGQIRLIALKPPPQNANVLTEESNIVELSITDKPDMQLSSVTVYYGQFDPTKTTDDRDNYQVVYTRFNSDAVARYRSNNTKTIFATWVGASNGQGARRIATLLGRRFGITPRETQFVLEDKDSSLWVGDIASINHYSITDATGLPKNVLMEIISAHESDLYTYRGLEYLYDKALADDIFVGIDVVDLAVSENNVNLRTRYDSIFGAPDASTVVKFIVYSNVVIGSDSTGTPSLTIGAFPSGAQVSLEIKQNAFIVGCGGNASSSIGSNGGNGGTAINVTNNFELINNGVIGGGGGGGGYAEDDWATAGGGGGAGRNVGVKGKAPTSTETIISQQSATDGSLESGGNRSFVIYQRTAEFDQVSGGNGGNLGQNGGNGDALLGNGSNGGLAGKAIDVNGFTITFTNTGDVRGAVSN